jgi:multicomponent Na+:H+ antiporter subunit E
MCGIRNHLGMRDACDRMTKGWLPRFVMGYGLWLVLAGWSPSDLVAGIPAAALAAWASVVLLPPKARLKPLRVLRYAAAFIWQSVAAGVDVAWRVFQPRMPLQPGIVKITPRFPAGVTRLWFCGLASLQPGSLPCGVDDEGNLLVHCLDTRQDVAGMLSRAQDDLEKLWTEDEA